MATMEKVNQNNKKPKLASDKPSALKKEKAVSSTSANNSPRSPALRLLYKPTITHPVPKVERVPTARPPFTVGDLKRAIPSHCFERSLWKSSAYLVADCLAIAALVYVSQFFDAPSVPVVVSWALWIGYWILAGLIGTGVWVIAHECGHEAFSDYPLVNDCVGLVAHTFVLVPYFSWKFSHAKHHSKTANVEKDEVYVPVVGVVGEEMQPTVFWSAYNFLVMALVGWLGYLVTHVSGRDYGKRTDHFSPSSPIFKPNQRKLVVLNDIAIGVMLFLLSYLAYEYTFTWVVKIYLIPYLHVNFWLVMITLMQHTDLKLPHFHDNDWNWLQGALATVDRDYGVLNVLFHHIGDTHVLHHLFSKIPHYHAQEATKAIIPILGKYYCADMETSVWSAMWTSTHYCRKVYPASEPQQQQQQQQDKALWYSY